MTLWKCSYWHLMAMTWFPKAFNLALQNTTFSKCTWNSSALKGQQIVGDEKEACAKCIFFVLGIHVVNNQ